MGVPAHVLEEARQALEERNKHSTTGVWPEHWHALRLLQAMSTQWRAAAGMGGLIWLGLDYAALPAVHEATRRAVPRRWRRPHAELLQQLQTMEAAALRVRNEKKE